MTVARKQAPKPVDVPRAFNASVAASILSVLQEGAPIEAAAKFAGVSPRTVYLWMARGRKEAGTILAQWVVEVDKAQAVCETSLLEAVTKAAKNAREVPRNGRRARSKGRAPVRERGLPVSPAPRPRRRPVRGRELVARTSVKAPQLYVDPLALALEELRRRRSATEFSAEGCCVDFPAQLEYVSARDKYTALCNPRRSGKTEGIGARLLLAARRPPFAHQGYVTSTLKDAKRRVWPVLRRLNVGYALGGQMNETEGVMRFPDLPNRPCIYLGGAKDHGEIDKLRGWAEGVKAWVIDEAQSFRPLLLKELIDDVIDPSLIDYDGSLGIAGTPGPIRAGFFYDATAGETKASWRQFGWKMEDNPHLERKSGKPVAQLLAELLERRKWTAQHPTFRREYLARATDDTVVCRECGGTTHPPGCSKYVRPEARRA